MGTWGEILPPPVSARETSALKVVPERAAAAEAITAAAERTGLAFFK